MSSARRAAARAVALVVLAAVVLSGAAPAGAQEAEVVDRYEVDITVLADGALEIVETIAYDFGGAERHGIERWIPVRERYDDTSDRVLRLEDVRVESPSAPDDVERTSEGNDEKLRIGDPDRTVTGPHTYEIAYRIEGALNAFDDDVELYWDAIGGEWAVPITDAAVRVHTPAAPTATACFVGLQRSAAACGQSPPGAEPATFTAGPLEPYEGLTVVVAVPSGAVAAPAPILDERWDPAHAFEPSGPALAGSGALLVVGVAALAVLGWRRGRDRRYVGSHVDVAFGNADGAEERVGLGGPAETPIELAPPDGLRPGQIGTLVDEVAHPLDVTATIVDLASRGYLRIDEIPKEGWFGKPDWRLHELRDGDGLLPYERRLFGGLFEKGRSEVQVSELKGRFAARMSSVQDDLYDDVAARGWFHTRPDHERRRWLAIGLGIAAVGVVLTVLAAAFTRLGLVPIPIVVVGLLLAAGNRFLPHRTAKGTAVLRRVEGFRRFIVESEQDRARFAEQAHLFSEYLPYAVVFGATDRWARAFAGLDGEVPAPSWYGATDAFSILHFSAVMDAFTVTTAGTLTSVPASSGGSGFSGGFSGGGMGGGGGGSW